MARVERPCREPLHEAALRDLERQGVTVTQRKERYAIVQRGNDFRRIAPDGTACRAEGAKPLVRRVRR